MLSMDDARTKVQALRNRGFGPETTLEHLNKQYAGDESTILAASNEVFGITRAPEVASTPAVERAAAVDLNAGASAVDERTGCSDECREFGPCEKCQATTTAAISAELDDISLWNVLPRDSNGKIPHGNLHGALLSKAGQMRRYGLNEEEIETTLLRLAREHFAPPLDESKVIQMAKSVCKSWPAGDPKEVLDGKLKFNQQPSQAAPVDTSNWRSMFRSVGEMEDGPIDMIIEGALQEGTCFIGANPGDGKTLVALAFAKAICTGTPLFNQMQFPVNKPRPVIYLIPESRDRAFRKRCESFQMPDDKSKFMARTISAGVPLELSDPYLMQAVKDTNAVVILDTASRFMKGNDENSAAQNRQLVNDTVALCAAGAVCVILIHHATKSAKTNGERMTLENMLRGTGDFGAMCDQAYGIRKDMNVYQNGSGPMEIDLVNLKDREQIGGLTQLRLAASYKYKITPTGRYEVDKPKSWIDETGNFRAVSGAETMTRNIQLLVAAVKSDPSIPMDELAERFDLSKYSVKTMLEKQGWHRVQGGKGGASPWHQDANGVCPYDTKVEVKPEKKTFDAGLPGVVAGLRAMLADGRITEPEVLAWADEQGITDAMLRKAGKRVGVVYGEDEREVKTWALPEADTSEGF